VSIVWSLWINSAYSPSLVVQLDIVTTAAVGGRGATPRGGIEIGDTLEHLFPPEKKVSDSQTRSSQI
jgi:hypothetical protein